jgi:UDP-glucose 4-epimerase
MNILIIGASGYLGGRIYERLYKNSPHVVKRASRKGGNDFWDRGNIQKITSNVDCVIYCIGLNSKECELSIEEAYKVNVINFERIINGSIFNGVKEIVYLSTAHVYGNLEGYIDENTPTNATHPYGASKKSAEDVLKYYGQRGDINFSILRLSNVFGAPILETQTCWTLLVNDLCKQVVENNSIILKTNGKQYRDFLGMDDFLLSLEFLIASETRKNTIYNLGSRKSISVLEMANLVADRAFKLFQINKNIVINNDNKFLPKPLDFNNEKFCSNGFSFKNNFINEIDEVLYIANKIKEFNRNS